ncbi:MAG TPA: LPXTG cell wall anchor domain-containing protein, partial [Acidimicrobiia bacterium]|nr:LPXTG cell wall anchor domain-containing protein [Acidimicrobiia bacterium]
STTVAPATTTTSTTVAPATTTTTTTAPPEEAAVALSQTTVPAGGQLTVSGAGWEPGSTVGLELHSSVVSLGQAAVGADGRFSTTVTIPAGTAAGSHEIVVSGADSTGTAQTASAPVTVESGVSPQASTTTAPPAGGGSLPRTGTPFVPLVSTGFALVGAGLALAYRRRRMLSPSR